MSPRKAGRANFFHCSVVCGPVPSSTWTVVGALAAARIASPSS
ncbi:hypothetical protein [Kitasatospora sp. NPDC127116]